jgi:hypothetical protein
VKEVGGKRRFRYANYAACWQDPLASYGEENWAFVGDVARRYDLEGVFQMRCPGGFKVSKVGG